MHQLDITAGQSGLLSTFFGTVVWIKVMITTGDMVNAFVLGFVGAAGALTVTLLVTLFKKTQPPLVRLYKKTIKKIWH